MKRPASNTSFLTSTLRPTLPSTLKHLINCSEQTIISTLNTRTLRPMCRLEELAENVEIYSNDILAIQEHRFYHPDDTLQYQSIGSYQLVTSSVTKNSNNSSAGGVGFLLSSKACNNHLNVESITLRIIILELEENPKTTIICAYSLHNDAHECDMHKFYSTLRATVEQVPQHKVLAITGDRNAKLGPDDSKFTISEETNRNGEMLADFMEEYNLFSSNNSYMKPKSSGLLSILLENVLN